MNIPLSIVLSIVSPFVIYLIGCDSNNSYTQLSKTSRDFIDFFEPIALTRLKPNLNVMQIITHQIKYNLNEFIEYIGPYYHKLNEHAANRIRAIFPNYKIIVEKVGITFFLLKVVRFNLFLLFLIIYIAFNLGYRLILNLFCIIDCILYIPLLILNYEISEILKPTYFRQNLVRQKIMLQTEFSTFINTVIICFVIAILALIFNMSFKQRSILY